MTFRIAFVRTSGSLIVHRGRYEVIIVGEAQGFNNWGEEPFKVFENRKGPNHMDLHTRNFAEAIKRNDASLLNAHIKSSSVAAINAQIGNITYRTARKVYWDSSTGVFKNDDEAIKMIRVSYDNGWKVPQN